ncbi:MAG: hypothetical protein U0T73_00525 [Chitinophagales bacterium]
MSSTSEKGHSRNVAAFASLIEICSLYGASYQPEKAALQIAALNDLLTKANAAMAVVNDKRADLARLVNQRQDLFKPLKPLVTRLVNALDAGDASAQTVKDARSIATKIWGRRKSSDSKAAAAPPAAGTPGEGAPAAAAGKSISVSQQSYDNQIEFFGRLVGLLEREPAYQPNAADLKVAALKDLHARLIAANNAIRGPQVAASQSVIDRNVILYAPNTGLVDVAIDVKKYVKSVFGATSAQYKQLTKLPIRLVI